MGDLTWCEVDVDALGANVRTLKALLPVGCLIAPAVKAEAYGHGSVVASRAFLAGGADWLCVNSAEEAARLRDAGIDAPVYVMGFVPPEDVEGALAIGCRLVVYREDVVSAAEAACARHGWTGRLHLKLETGNERQGLREEEGFALARRIHASPHLVLEGVASHFANVEDTTDHAFARRQLARFREFNHRLGEAGIPVPMPHLSNSAAVLLWSEEHRRLARVGISAYGMWPSSETLVAALMAGRERIALRPALAWKARIAQIRDVPKGAFVGYGCSYQTTAAARIAVLPVGYYDGYDRGLSNVAHVLVRGQRAPVRGRVCMNLTMVDVSHVEGVSTGDVAVLLGRDGDEAIAAEQLAGWIGTINYEVTTRIGAHVPRRPIGAPTTAERPPSHP
jgi:alanine racemase